MWQYHARIEHASSWDMHQSLSSRATYHPVMTIPYTLYPLYLSRRYKIDRGKIPWTGWTAAQDHATSPKLAFAMHKMKKKVPWSIPAMYEIPAKSSFYLPPPTYRRAQQQPQHAIDHHHHLCSMTFPCFKNLDILSTMSAAASLSKVAWDLCDSIVPRKWVSYQRSRCGVSGYQNHRQPSWVQPGAPRNAEFLSRTWNSRLVDLVSFGKAEWAR